MSVSWVAVIAAMFAIATPLAYGALGAILGERTGVLNLGIEGTMCAGAFGGFLAAEESEFAVARHLRRHRCRRQGR